MRSWRSVMCQAGSIPSTGVPLGWPMAVLKGSVEWSEGPRGGRRLQQAVWEHGIGPWVCVEESSC